MILPSHPKVEQRLVWVEDDAKPQALLGALLALEQRTTVAGAGAQVMPCAVVFVNTKDAARLVEQRVRGWKFQCFSIHGDKKQEAREEALGRFQAHIEGRFFAPRVQKPHRGASDRAESRRDRPKGAVVLVATDVAARGLDIPNISCATWFG